MKRARYKRGSVVFDKRRKVWNFLFCDGETRPTKLIGSIRDYPSKAAAWRAVESNSLSSVEEPINSIPTLRTLTKRYEAEKLVSRSETARVYKSWLETHILPYWGDQPISALQPRPVELWLRSLALSPKSKSHVRNLLRILVEFAMWSGVLEVSRKPIDLVVVKGASPDLNKAGVQSFF